MLTQTHSNQCDQIGRFIGLWATFQSLWQQLVCPNHPHSQAIFVNVSKSFIFLVKSFLGNFLLVTLILTHNLNILSPSDFHSVSAFLLSRTLQKIDYSDLAKINFGKIFIFFPFGMPQQSAAIVDDQTRSKGSVTRLSYILNILVTIFLSIVGQIQGDRH